MGENKGQTIFLSVIGIATLLVAIIGATFAYFTTSMGGTQGTVKATTAKIGAASFTAQSVSGTAVLPGWNSEAKTVTVTLGPSDYDVKYTCTLDMTTNPLTDLTLTVAGTNAQTTVNGKLKPGGTKTVIARGTLAKSATEQTATMTYTLSFPETGADQNGQQGATIAGTVSCATEGKTVYYNAANPSGTTTAPTGNQ